MELIQIRLDDKSLDAINKMVADGKFANKNEAIRYAIFRHLFNY
jgi:Arc/MetJ-type ribon-helix-helix transcriptional regulator